MLKNVSFSLLVSATTVAPSFALDLNDVRRASGSPPVVKVFSGARDVFEYDLKIRSLCDSPQSLNTIAAAWVGPKRTGNIFEDGLNFDDKSVALAAVVTFPNAKPDQIKQVKMPIVAKSNFGETQVQNCEGTIISDVPANAKIRIHFEYRSTDVTRFEDPAKFVSGITKIGTSAVALGAIASGAGAIGAALVPVVSYLEKNGSAITTLNTGVNEVMESFATKRSPDPKQYEIKSTASTISYNSGKKTVIVIDKIARDTGPIIEGLNGWLPISRSFSDRYGDLQSQFNNAQSAVESPWSANLPKFCAKLRSYIDGVTKGDRFASALGIGFHAFYNSTEYNGKTCLNLWEVAALKSRNFSPPFPGAWTDDGVNRLVATSMQPAKLSKQTRMAKASIDQ